MTRVTQKRRSTLKGPKSLEKLVLNGYFWPIWSLIKFVYILSLDEEGPHGIRTWKFYVHAAIIFWICFALIFAIIFLPIYFENNKVIEQMRFEFKIPADIN